MATRVTTAPAAPGSRTSSASIPASSSRTPRSTRSTLVPASEPIFLSVHLVTDRHELRLPIGEDRVLLRLGHARHLLEHRIADVRFGRHHADPEDRPLQLVLRRHLRDGDIEPRPHPIAELAND